MSNDTNVLRAALLAEDPNWSPTGSEVHIRESVPVRPDDSHAEAGAAQPNRLPEREPHGGGAPISDEPTFDASALADRLREGPIHRDYTPSPAVVAHRHRP